MLSGDNVRDYLIQQRKKHESGDATVSPAAPRISVSLRLYILLKAMQLSAFPCF